MVLLSLKLFHNIALVKSKGKYQHFRINNTERIPCPDTSPEETLTEFSGRRRSALHEYRNEEGRRAGEGK